MGPFGKEQLNIMCMFSLCKTAQLCQNIWMMIELNSFSVGMLLLKVKQEELIKLQITFYHIILIGTKRKLSAYIYDHLKNVCQAVCLYIFLYFSIRRCPIKTIIMEDHVATNSLHFIL